MASFSLIFIVGAITMYKLGLGDASLVYANILNLSARIAYALHFISSYFQAHSCQDCLKWRSVIPQKRLIVVSVLSLLIVLINSDRSNATDIVRAGGKVAFLQSEVIGHIALGAILCLASVAVWWLSSPKLLPRTKDQ